MTDSGPEEPGAPRTAPLRARRTRRSHSARPSLPCPRGDPARATGTISDACRATSRDFATVDSLWVKHEDLSSDVLGGNKVRSLEFLLGRLGRGDTVLTLGGVGSTHILATAVHAARLGAKTIAVRWRHDMHPAAQEVSERTAAECAEVVTASNFVTAMPPLFRLRLTRHAHYIPLGGSTRVRHVGSRERCARAGRSGRSRRASAAARLVVPLGSGGTAAGLALGFAIAGLETIGASAHALVRALARIVGTCFVWRSERVS